MSPPAGDRRRRCVAAKCVSVDTVGGGETELVPLERSALEVQRAVGVPGPGVLDYGVQIMARTPA
jgi:hypothetical protein